MNKINVYLLPLFIGTASLSYSAGQANWHIIGGVNNTFDSQTFNAQPGNMPTVDASGNTPYLMTTISGGSPIMLIDDDQYANRKTYSTKFSGNPFLGLEAKVSPDWTFRIKTILNRNDMRIMDVRTLLYTPSTALGNASVTCYNAQSNCTLPNIMPGSEETLTITQNSHPELAVSFLYRFSDYFTAGPTVTSAQEKYSLSLNGNTQTSTFKPSANAFGVESLFRLSDRLSLATSVSFANNKSYIKRLLNFSVTANNSSSPTSYQLSYIPVDTDASPSWQSCSGYEIGDSSCTNASSQTASVTNYYYNTDTPSAYGATIPVQSIDNTLGPYLGFNRFWVRATVSLEWNYALQPLLPRAFNL